MSSRQWKSLADTLAPSYRVLVPDLLGIGRNPPWPDHEPFHFQSDLDALVRILERLPEPAHVVGHSYGGFLSVLLAQRFPRLVKSVAAYDPVAFGVLYDPPDEAGLADLTRATDDPAFRDPAIGGTDPWMEAFVDFWNGKGAWRMLPEPTRNAFLRVGKKVFFEVTTLMTDRTPRLAYAAFGGPALLLSGSLSPIAARRVVSILASAFPRGSLVSIEGAGHMGPITHARDVNQAIVRHLAGA